jgi:ubiquinol-cytochrome c reductase cytochrome c subunit
MFFIAPVLLAAVLGVSAPGARIYAENCASCHGAQQQGSADGPALHRVGMAGLDFYLSTGRMPAAAPWIEVAHRDERAGQQLPLAQIRALETYLAPVVAGGPALPEVVDGQHADRGRSLYQINCQQCHAVGGSGGSIGRADWAPALHQATINEVADAVRAGPGEMPRFGEQQLTPADLDDLAGYVLSMDAAQPGNGGIPSPSTGPVPEGALGYVAIVVLIVFVFGLGRGATGKREQ